MYLKIKWWKLELLNLLIQCSTRHIYVVKLFLVTTALINMKTVAYEQLQSHQNLTHMYGPIVAVLTKTTTTIKATNTRATSDTCLEKKHKWNNSNMIIIGWDTEDVK